VLAKFVVVCLQVIAALPAAGDTSEWGWCIPRNGRWSTKLQLWWPPDVGGLCISLWHV